MIQKVILNKIETKLLEFRKFQNNDVFSPFYGMFDYNYWRDKKRNFPDARYQEIFLSFYLLSNQKNDYLNIAYSAIDALEKMQKKNGTFDEWYKNDHGIAATTYIGINLLEFYLIAKSYKYKTKAKNIIYKIYNHLKTSNDIIKINHQAALVYFFCLFSEANFPQSIYSKKLAKKKYEILFENRNNSGWFHEVAGKDIGYTFLLIDYLCLSELIIPKLINHNEVQKLYEEAITFLDFNLQHDTNLSFTANGYFSLISSIFFYNKSENAKTIIKLFLDLDDQKKIDTTSHFLNDELRFSRWASLILISNKRLTNKINEITKYGNKIKKIKHSPSFIANDKSLLSLKHNGFFIHASPFNSGFIKIFNKKTLFVFNNIRFKKNNDVISSEGYSEREVIVKKNLIRYPLFMKKINYINPNTLIILLVSSLSKFPLIAKTIRFFIDLYRKNKKTSMNQSGFPISKGRIFFTCFIEVHFFKNFLEFKLLIPSKIRNIEINSSNKKWLINYQNNFRIYKIILRNGK